MGLGTIICRFFKHLLRTLRFQFKMYICCQYTILILIILHLIFPYSINRRIELQRQRNSLRKLQDFLFFQQCDKDKIYNNMQKLKVVEFQGLAPSVFCGLYFADQGAQVTLVAREESAPVSIPINKNILNRNKKCITINLKNKDHFQIILKLLSDADVLIDPYRPGVLEKLRLGPKDLYVINKRIILLRVSGYGQSGSAALRPGHDLNYISVSGIMELINKQKQYQFPSNYLADFVSASLGITGTLGALHQREKTGVGKVIDCSLAHGCTYLAQNIQTVGLGEQENTSKVFEMKANGKNYIYNTKNNRFLKEEQLLNLIKDQEYYRSKDGDIQISVVKEIQPLLGNKLVNPFSQIQLSNLIKSKGEDDNEVFSKLRAKL